MEQLLAQHIQFRERVCLEVGLALSDFYNSPVASDRTGCLLIGMFMIVFDSNYTVLVRANGFAELNSLITYDKSCIAVTAGVISSIKSLQHAYNRDRNNKTDS